MTIATSIRTPCLATTRRKGRLMVAGMGGMARRALRRAGRAARMGAADYAPLADAPGTYVLQE